MNKLLGLVTASTIASAAIAITPFSVEARIGLSFLDSFGGSADGIVYNPVTNTIFGLDTELLSPPPNVVTEWEATEYDLFGEELSSFTSDVVPAVLGGAALPSGNLLVVFPGGGRVVELTPDGETVVGGVDFASDDIFHLRPRGLEINPDNSLSILGSAGTILNVDLTGNINSTFDISGALPPDSSVQGIAIDPVTGNYLIADQFEGNSSIYEVSPLGELITTINDLGGFGDPEGLSFNPSTRNLYVAFDDDAPDGGRIAVFAVEKVPEPTSLLALITLGTFGISSALKRNRFE